MSINHKNQEILDKFTKHLDLRVKNKTKSKGSTVRKSTMLTYLSDIRQYLDFLGDTFIGDADEDTTNEYFSSLKGIKNDDICATTRNRKIVSLNHLFEYLNSRGIINNTVMTHIEQAEIKTADQIDDEDIEEKSFLERDEIDRFLKYMNKQISHPKQGLRVPKEVVRINAIRDRAMFHMMIECGLRVGEVLSLELYQITTRISPDGIEYVNVHIPASKSKNGRKRDIPCSMKILDQIDEYRECINYDNEPVFLSKNGNKMTTSDVANNLTKYMNAIGVEKNITPHSLRHTYAVHNSQLLQPFELASRMGHQDIKITMTYYHVSEDSHCKILSF